jgi:Fe-S-cluster containining protein
VSDEFAEFIMLHNIPLVSEDGVKKLIVESLCRWRDDEVKRCTHYDSRPKYCREYFCERAKT